MTIQEIIKCRSCSELFPDDSVQAEKIYLSLMKKFHPDVCSDSLCGEACAVINNLYSRIKKCPKIMKFHAYNCDIDYIREYKREDGTMYFNSDSISYLLDHEIYDCLENAPGFRYNISPDILKQAESFLPDVRNIEQFPDNRIIVHIRTCKNEFPLDEAVNFFGGKPDPRHCAWIISRLLGMCCFAKISGIVWNCLCTENLLINPEMHTLRIAGGWWFSSEEGSKISGVQSEIYENMPSSCRTDGIARSITDLECVKSVCRKIFPENSPEPMQEFAENSCMSDAFDEMEYWEETINKSFGGKYFTPMKLCFADIYSK